MSEAWRDLPQSAIASGFSSILSVSNVSQEEEESISKISRCLELTYLSTNDVTIATFEQDVVDPILEISL